MKTSIILLVIFIHFSQIFHLLNGFVIEQPLPVSSSELETPSKIIPLATRQLSFNVDTGSGRRPGMSGGANTFEDTTLSALRGGSLLLADTLVNAYSGITQLINMIQNYVQTGSFQFDNLSSTSQVLTSRLMELGSNAATSLLNMLSNEMSSSAANGAPSSSGINAALSPSQFIASENAPVTPLHVGSGRQSTSTLFPVGGNTSVSPGISSQSLSVSSSQQPQIGASFPGVTGTSSSPGVFGQRVGVTSASSAPNSGGTSGWGGSNSVFGWGSPGNGVNWGSSGSGSSFGWGAPNGVVGWRGNPMRVPGSGSSNGMSNWGISGLGGSNGMSGWYGPGMFSWNGGPPGVWVPGISMASSGTTGGWSGWGGPNGIGWRGPGGIAGWGNSASGTGAGIGTGASGGSFSWGAPNGVVGWSSPTEMSGWGGADSITGSGGFGGSTGSGSFGGSTGSGGFGGLSGWDNSSGMDTDINSMDFMNGFAMYGAGNSNTTSTISPLLQLLGTMISSIPSAQSTEKTELSSGSESNVSNLTTPTV